MFPSWAPPSDGAAGIATRCDGLQGGASSIAVTSRLRTPAGSATDPNRPVESPSELSMEWTMTARSSRRSPSSGRHWEAAGIAPNAATEVQLIYLQWFIQIYRPPCTVSCTISDRIGTDDSSRVWTDGSLRERHDGSYRHKAGRLHDGRPSGFRLCPTSDTRPTAAPP